jgi:hypothetical protein
MAHKGLVMKSLLLLLLIPFANAPISYRQLTWEDFKGKPPVAAQGDACTCTNIAIGYDTAYAIFIPERSWTKTNDRELLRHEQFHFTITYYWADFISRERKLKPPYSAHNIEQVLRHWHDMQEKYDTETNHGTDSAAQKRWEGMIKL